MPWRDKLYRFWDSIIEPSIRLIGPNVIVEIGAWKGDNTSRLLEYCRIAGAVAHIIDPSPLFDVEAWQKRYPKEMVFHRAFSLNVLHRIELVDVVLIDGDHNWYTVNNELLLLERTCEKNNSLFPLVFLHDVEWPYGFRDNYYQPESIPRYYRQQHDKKGLDPGCHTLKEKGGLNAHLDNAVEEGKPHSGVCTALNDFCFRKPGHYVQQTLSGLFGLGLVTSRERLDGNTALADFFKSLVPSEPIQKHLKNLEFDRLGLLMEVQALRLKLS